MGKFRAWLWGSSSDYQVEISTREILVLFNELDAHAVSIKGNSIPITYPILVTVNSSRLFIAWHFFAFYVSDLIFSDNEFYIADGWNYCHILHNMYPKIKIYTVT